MSTRAVYTFKDEYDTYAVYGHHDGYLSGAAEKLENALPFAWQGGRFEAADLAAAFIRGNKDEGGGSIYFTKSQSRHGDLSYDYVVTNKDNVKWLQVYEHRWSEDKGKKRTQIWKGPLLFFIADYKEKSAA